LDEYRTTREERFASTSRRVQAAAGLLVVGLQQRLLSSIEAFAQSLAVHRRTVERRHAAAETKAMPSLGGQAELLVAAPGPDDEPAEWSDSELLAAEADAI